MDTITDADRARIAARYPARRSRGWLVAAAALLAALLLGWTVWAGWTAANPGIHGQLYSYTVVDDAHIDVVVRVHRPDPSRTGSCTVQAQAPSGEVVAELELPVAPAPDKDVELRATLKTYLRAHTAIVTGCALT